MFNVKKIYEGDTWQTIFYTDSGSVAFHSNGTVALNGSLSASVVARAFDIFTSARGLDWWRLFAIDQFNRKGARLDASSLADRLNIGNTLPGIAQNKKLMRWIRQKHIQEYISADTFSGARATLWDSALDRPRTDTTAKAVIKHIKANRDISRPKLREYIKSLQ